MSDSEKDLSTIIGYYLEEWKHRDNMYIKHTYTYFWSILIVSLFPNIEFISNNLVKIINPKIFNVLGLVLSLAFLYISLSLGKRLTKVGKKYDSLLQKLSSDYCHDKIDNVLPLFTKMNNVTFITVFLFAILFLLNIIMIVLN